MNEYNGDGGEHERFHDSSVNETNLLKGYEHFFNDLEGNTLY
jgi:hypothetical protein